MRINKILVTFAALLSFSSSAHDFGLNDLRFTNRAQCALDSKLPTESAFLVVNNIDPGRAVYKLAKATGSDTKELTAQGIEIFRYSVVSLFHIIHNKLVKKELPLLASDTTRTDIHLPNDYKKIAKSCSGEEKCLELNSYIEKLWKNSERKVSSGTKFLGNYKIDNFHSKDSYLDKKIYDKKKAHKLSCHYLKEFSPLQAHLFGTKPNRKAYQSLGEALTNIDKYMGDCFDFEGQKNLKVAAYQFELTGLKEKKWGNKGFDYWHSMKVYFSWAFRNAEVMKSLANQFYPLFKGLEIENLVMLVPNGCKSITSPKCDGGLLSKNSIREFAKADFDKKVMDMDMFQGVPEGPQDDLLNDPFTEVNTDILDLRRHGGADAWAQNMVDNLSGTRNTVKNNLVKAVNFTNILSRHFPNDDFNKYFTSYFNEVLTAKSANQQLKNELYYLCSEYYFLSHDTFSTVKGKLDVLKKAKVLDEKVLNFSEQNISNLFGYFDTMSKEVVKICGKLSQKEIFDDSFELDRSGYQQWYLDKVFTKAKKKSNYQEVLNKKNESTTKPLIAYGVYEENSSLENVVCLDAVHCARQLAKSVVDIYRATTYAGTLWAKKGELADSGMFNPYSERLACKVYDPWFKTKSIIFNLFSDIGQSALTYVTPGLIYGRVGLKPGRVVSFKQLVNEGMIEYSPDMDPQKIVAGLTADFGPMLGVPCKVSVSSTAHNPYNQMKFLGISVGTCSAKEEHQTIANSGSDINQLPVEDRSRCAGCSLDFESISTSASHFAQNVGPVYFLVRAFVRLYKGLKDPHNIPRDWIAQPDDIYHTFQKYGYIPERCVRKFRKGRRCR